MGNAIDCTITVMGSSEMLARFRRAVRENWELHPGTEGGWLRRLEWVARPSDWRIGLRGGHPCFYCAVSTKTVPPIRGLQQTSGTFPGMTFECDWVDCTGGEVGLVIARAGCLLTDDVWPDAGIDIDEGVGFDRGTPDQELTPQELADRDKDSTVPCTIDAGRETKSGAG